MDPLLFRPQKEINGMPLPCVGRAHCGAVTCLLGLAFSPPPLPATQLRDAAPPSKQAYSSAQRSPAAAAAQTRRGTYTPLKWSCCAHDAATYSSLVGPQESQPQPSMISAMRHRSAHRADPLCPAVGPVSTAPRAVCATSARRAAVACVRRVDTLGVGRRWTRRGCAGT